VSRSPHKTAQARPRQNRPQRGGFALGLVAGLLLGLILALGVALYITKAPVPFVDKVPLRTAEQDQAEAERNRDWNPNAALASRGAPPDVPAPGGPLPPGIAPAVPEAGAGGGGAPTTTDPAAILGGSVTPGSPAGGVPAADPFIYFVQVGAYTRTDEAEQQRARLALLGLESRITERQQAGRTVYRVRVGPYPTRADADLLQSQIQNSGFEAQIVRVERGT
jgi:cell division protein FtsN